MRRLINGPAWGVVRFAMIHRQDVRNVAVIAHVDHGKTTLVDVMLQQSGTLANARNRVMDSKDQEKERGITILAKNTAIVWNGKRINIVDTPGHLDFGGEVERALQMVEGFLLLVDVKEGVRPGTRYVLRKALALGLSPIVLLNKIDKDDTNVAKTTQGIEELFMDIAVSPEQLEIPFLYGSGRSGYMNKTMLKEGTLTPLFEGIFEHIPAPRMEEGAPFQMLVAQLGEDVPSASARTAIGRVFSGSAKIGDIITVAAGEKKMDGLVTELHTYLGLQRSPVKEVQFGDVCDVVLKEPIGETIPLMIGATIGNKDRLNVFPYRPPDDPTFSLTVLASTAPWKGKEGKENISTLPMLEKRLIRESHVNSALRLERQSDRIVMHGRGPLHLSVIVEDMRREGHEFEILPPSVPRRTVDGVEMEPYEKLTLSVKRLHSSEIMTLLSSKHAEITNIEDEGEDRVIITATIAVRMMTNLPLAFHRMTGGDGILQHSFEKFDAICPVDVERKTGALINVEDGTCQEYSMSTLHAMGVFFVQHGDPVFYGQIVGENRATLGQNSAVNVTKKNEQQGGMRANATDKAQSKRVTAASTSMSLEEAIAWIIDDELVTVTPQSIRMRKPNFTGKTTMRKAKK